MVTLLPPTSTKRLLELLLIHHLLLYKVLGQVGGSGSRVPDSPPYTVSTVEGGQAQLPCDITSGPGRDSVYLVLWYRKDSGTPIYSYDSRTGDPGNKGLWSEPEAFGDRAYFRVGESPAVLSISNLTKEDGGVYTCRVDYTESPTMYHNVKLDVIVPPSIPRILGDRGKQLSSMKPVGPFKEGDPLTIQCVATGGEPPPSVLWYRENEILDKTYIANEKGAVQNTLTIQRLDRKDMGPRYRCVASNNNMTLPKEAWVSLDIMFPPLGAKIITEDQPLVAGREYNLGCVSWGSLPASEISWYRRQSSNSKGIIPMSVNPEDMETTISKDNNVTESWIRFTPTPLHHQQIITCRATNYKLQGTNNVMEDHRVLDVFFAPHVELNLGPAVNPRDLEEGDDVYFECHIKAHPPAYKVTWRHKGQEIYPRPGDGKIISNQSLVLQKVGKEDGGNYTCQAFNVEGQMESKPQFLDIMYRPSCLTEQKMIYGVSEKETAHISCTVDSNPKADSFFWTLNTTAGHSEIPGAMSTDMAGASLLTYKPMSQLEYGTIFCFGSNIVGRQEQPCVFHIIPATVPETPHHCHIANQTLIGLRVVCDSGFDGGLEQTFHMEVLSLSDNVIYANVSRDVPSFWATSLPPGEKVYIRVYSSNTKGRCTPVILQAETSMAAGVGYPIKHEREIAEEGFSILLVLLLGTILTIILLGVVVGLVMRCSDPAHHHHHQLSRGSDNGFETLQRKGVPSDNMSSLQYQTSVFQDTRISPDVIPDSFTQINKCQDLVHGFADVKQEAHFHHNAGRMCTPDGSDSSGFSEKAGSSEVSCSDYCRGRPHETGPDCGLPPPYSAKVCVAGYNDRNIREQSGKVFPSDVQIMAGKSGCVNPALTECPYSTLPRMPSGSMLVNKAPMINAATRRKLFSSSLQLNLNCVRQDPSVENPLLRPLGDCEDSYIQMISARTPLIEAESDRESCV